MARRSTTVHQHHHLYDLLGTRVLSGEQIMNSNNGLLMFSVAVGLISGLLGGLIGSMVTVYLMSR